MLKDFSYQSLVTGFLAALVGFASSFAVVLQGLYAMGASTEQAAAGLMALCLGMGVSGILLSANSRMPISVAWSTPGAALLASSVAPEGGFAVAVGSFIICALLLMLAGFWSPLARLVAAIPKCIANAMLAGILFGLCLAPVEAVAQYPRFALPIILAWVIAGQFHKLLAVPAALLVFFLEILVFKNVSGFAPISAVEAGNASDLPIQLQWIAPQFTLASIIGIALPLFLVTMASQNIPGLAVLNINRYTPKPGLLFSTTGLFSLLSAPFGGHAVNLAAITAAMCAGEDANKDLNKRYWAAVVAGLVYVLIGIFAGLVTKLVTLAPVLLVQTVAGLALVGACAASLFSAFESEPGREAGAVTFFITASGLSYFGVSGAFWGLLVGWAIYSLKHRKRHLISKR